jgi:hypothetical protein
MNGATIIAFYAFLFFKFEAGFRDAMQCHAYFPGPGICQWVLEGGFVIDLVCRYSSVSLHDM